MSSEYPRKYWWVVLIAIPLLVAVIGGVFDRCGKDSENPQTSLRNETTYNIDNSNKTIIPATNSERAAIKRVMDELEYLDRELQSYLVLLPEKADSIKSPNDLHNLFDNIFLAVNTMSESANNVDLSDCPNEFRFSAIKYRTQIIAFKTTLSSFMSLIQRMKEQDPFGTGIGFMIYQEEIKTHLEKVMNLSKKVLDAQADLKDMASKYLPK